MGEGSSIPSCASNETYESVESEGFILVMDLSKTMGPGEPPAATACYSLCSRSPQTVSALAGYAHISRDGAGRVDHPLHREGTPFPLPAGLSPDTGRAQGARGSSSDVQFYASPESVKDGAPVPIFRRRAAPPKDRHSPLQAAFRGP